MKLNLTDDDLELGGFGGMEILEDYEIVDVDEDNKTQVCTFHRLYYACPFILAGL